MPCGLLGISGIPPRPKSGEGWGEGESDSPSRKLIEPLFISAMVEEDTAGRPLLYAADNSFRSEDHIMAVDKQAEHDQYHALPASIHNQSD